jgi:hypothetical protein
MPFRRREVSNCSSCCGVSSQGRRSQRPVWIEANGNARLAFVAPAWRYTCRALSAEVPCPFEAQVFSRQVPTSQVEWSRRPRQGKSTLEGTTGRAMLTNAARATPRLGEDGRSGPDRTPGQWPPPNAASEVLDQAVLFHFSVACCQPAAKGRALGRRSPQAEAPSL